MTQSYTLNHMPNICPTCQEHFINLIQECQNSTASAEKISYIQNGSRPVSSEKMRDKHTIKGRCVNRAWWKFRKLTCLKIYDQRSELIVLEHEAQLLTFQLYPEGRTSPSSLRVAHVWDHHLQRWNEPESMESFIYKIATFRSNTLYTSRK